MPLHRFRILMLRQAGLVLFTESLHHRGDVILTADLDVAGDRADFYSLVRRGEFLAIYRGVYVRSDLWQTLEADARYLLRLTAAREIEPDAVFSHESAAAIWQLPIVGPWPKRAHVVRPPWDAGRSNSILVRHSFEIEETIWIDGFRVTSLARTVADIAATSSFGVAVTMADAALRRTLHPVAGVPVTSLEQADLLTELHRIAPSHGSARARKAIEFADAAADRPGESMSRVAMRIAKVTPPELQVVLYGASGRRYVVDFWWPRFGVIGEFDGDAKYTDPDFLRGRTPAQALRDEKDREDDLRAAGHGMSRWGWTLALSPAGLRAHLALAGVR